MPVHGGVGRFRWLPDGHLARVPGGKKLAPSAKKPKSAQQPDEDSDRDSGFDSSSGSECLEGLGLSSESDEEVVFGKAPVSKKQAFFATTEGLLEKQRRRKQELQDKLYGLACAGFSPSDRDSNYD